MVGDEGAVADGGISVDDIQSATGLPVVALVRTNVCIAAGNDKPIQNRGCIHSVSDDDAIGVVRIVASSANVSRKNGNVGRNVPRIRVGRSIPGKTTEERDAAFERKRDDSVSRGGRLV